MSANPSPSTSRTSLRGVAWAGTGTGCGSGGACPHASNPSAPKTIRRTILSIDHTPVVTDDDEPVVLDITDVLDLHTFRPSDVKDLVPDYLDEAAARGFTTVRIIHGKGTGTLRTLVHALLARHPLVASFSLATDRSGWGATLVTLKPPEVPPT
jgi:hypothetical protein